MSSKTSATTAPQTAVSYFPEFYYEIYWRLLERTRNGYSAVFELSLIHISFYMDGAAHLGKYIGMNAYKKSRMQNVLNAAGLKMTPETYMAVSYTHLRWH